MKPWAKKYDELESPISSKNLKTSCQFHQRFQFDDELLKWLPSMKAHIHPYSRGEKTRRFCQESSKVVGSAGSTGHLIQSSLEASPSFRDAAVDRPLNCQGSRDECRVTPMWESDECPGCGSSHGSSQELRTVVTVVTL